MCGPPRSDSAAAYGERQSAPGKPPSFSIRITTCSPSFRGWERSLDADRLATAATGRGSPTTGAVAPSRRDRGRLKTKEPAVSIKMRASEEEVGSKNLDAFFKRAGSSSPMSSSSATPRTSTQSVPSITYSLKHRRRAGRRQSRRRRSTAAWRAAFWRTRPLNVILSRSTGRTARFRFRIYDRVQADAGETFKSCRATRKWQEHASCPRLPAVEGKNHPYGRLAALCDGDRAGSQLDQERVESGAARATAS